MGSPFAMKHRRNPIHGMSLALHSSLSTSAPSELPSVATLRDKAQKVGRLKKLSGKGILTAGTWRERFCLLVKSKLYFYESEDSTGSEKSAGFVNLEYFDTCTEASTRMARKATNVFVIGSTEKGFFDSHSGRHYFAAETLPEMKEWVNAINVAMNHVRSKEKRTQSRDGPHTPTQKKDSSGGKSKQKDEENSTGTGTLPRTGARLDHVTKGRVKGPPGRRLPRKSMIKSMNPGDLKSDAILDPFGDSQSDEDIVRDVRGRATSLSALEASSETHPKASLSGDKNSRNQSTRDEDEYWGNRSMDYDSMDTSTTLGDTNMAYRYSSSEESFEDDEELIIPTIPSGAKGNFRQSPHLSSSGSFNQSKSQTRSNSSGSGFTRGKGTPVRNSSVTPPPCVLRKFRRDQMGSSNTAKAPKEEDSSSALILPDADMNPRRTSSGSSLSTLTADTYSHGQVSGQISYSSLQRPGRRMSAVAEQTQRQNYPQRNSSSANASPLMNGGNFANGNANGHSNFSRNGTGYNGNSFNSSTSSNGSTNGKATARGFQIERNIYSVKKELESVSFETKQLDIDITTLRQDVGSVQENIATVRGALDITRERVGRLSNQVLNVERQISSIIKEATNMREQAKKLMESAEIAKATHENMLEEAENLLVFLRQNSSTCFSCHHQHPHQHMRQQFPPNCCPSPSPIPSYYGSGPNSALQQNQTYPVLRRKSKSKTPDRSLDSEAEMELLDESEIMDIPKHRMSKSFNSNSSSGSNTSNRTSVIEMAEHVRSNSDCKEKPNSDMHNGSKN